MLDFNKCFNLLCFILLTPTSFAQELTFPKVKHNYIPLSSISSKDVIAARLIDSFPPESKSRIKHIQLKNAMHAFELPRLSSSFFDPYSFKGKWGEVSISYKKEATRISVTQAVSFVNNRILNKGDQLKKFHGRYSK